MSLSLPIFVAAGFGEYTSGIFLNLGVLWVIVILFTESTDAERSYLEVWVVIFGVLLAGLFATFLLPSGFEVLGVVAQAIALFFLVEWSCGTDRRATWKICGTYLVTCVVLHVTGRILFNG